MTAVLTDGDHSSTDGDADPLLARLLTAWHRLSDADRLVVVTQAERRVDGLEDTVSAG